MGVGKKYWWLHGIHSGQYCQRRRKGAESWSSASVENGVPVTANVPLLICHIQHYVSAQDNALIWVVGEVIHTENVFHHVTAVSSKNCQLLRWILRWTFLSWRIEICSHYCFSLCLKFQCLLRIQDKTFCYGAHNTIQNGCHKVYETRIYWSYMLRCLVWKKMQQVAYLLTQDSDYLLGSHVGIQNGVHEFYQRYQMTQVRTLT